MNITQINTAKTLNYKTNQVSQNNYERKSDDKISEELTEKFEPGKKDSPEKLSNSTKQFNIPAPVIKSNLISKSFFERINYTDLSEKVFSESKSKNVIISENNNNSLTQETIEEIGTGFYLTIPESDLKKLSKYVKGKQNKAEEYSWNMKAKKGVLVNLVV